MPIEVGILTGEGGSIDEIEKRLNPAPVGIEKILEWFLRGVSGIIPHTYENESSLPESQPAAQMLVHARHY